MVWANYLKFECVPGIGVLLYCSKTSLAASWLENSRNPYPRLICVLLFRITFTLTSEPVSAHHAHVNSQISFKSAQQCHLATALVWLIPACEGLTDKHAVQVVLICKVRQVLHTNIISRFSTPHKWTSAEDESSFKVTAGTRKVRPWIICCLSTWNMLHGTRNHTPLQMTPLRFNDPFPSWSIQVYMSDFKFQTWS